MQLRVEKDHISQAVCGKPTCMQLRVDLPNIFNNLHILFGEHIQLSSLGEAVP